MIEVAGLLLDDKPYSATCTAAMKANHAFQPITLADLGLKSHFNIKITQLL